MRLDALNLWRWATAQADALERDVPLSIHSRHGDRDDWGSGSGIIRGLPFSRAFLAYLDGRLPSSHLADAVKDIRSSAHGHVEKVGADIIRLVVAGEHDPQVLRRRMHVSESEFQQASLWALSALRRHVEHPQERADLAQANDDLAARQRMMRSRNASSQMPSPTA